MEGVVATSFVTRLLRFRGTLAGQKCVSRRGGYSQLGDTKARSPGREIVRGGSRKVGLLVVGRSRRPAQSTQHHRIALAMSHCLGTSCRIRVTNSPSRSPTARAQNLPTGGCAAGSVRRLLGRRGVEIMWWQPADCLARLRPLLCRAWQLQRCIPKRVKGRQRSLCELVQ